MPKLLNLFAPGDILVSTNLSAHAGARWEVLAPPFLDRENTVVHAKLTHFSGGAPNHGTQTKEDWDVYSYPLKVFRTAKEVAAEKTVSQVKESHDYYTQLTAITLE